jgi:hypothetical protein
MALWEDGKVRQVDPFIIPLPEEEGGPRPGVRVVAHSRPDTKIFGRDDDL